MKKTNNSSPINKIYNQDEGGKTSSKQQNLSPIRQQHNGNGSKSVQNSTSSILERLKEKQAQPPKLVISGINNASGNNTNLSNSQTKISKNNSQRQISNGKSPNNRQRQQLQISSDSEITRINQSPEKIQLHEQYQKYKEEYSNGRGSNQSLVTPTSPTKQYQQFPQQSQMNNNNSGFKKSPIQNKSLTLINDNQEQFYKHLTKSNSEMIASNVLEKIVDLEIKLKKELLKNQHLENQMDAISKSNEKLSRLNHDLTMQNSTLVNQITINDQDYTPNKQRNKSSNKHEFMDKDNQEDESSLQDLNTNDINYIKNLESECNKLQVLLEQKNRELQNWMQRYIEMQKKKEIRIEESETFNIMKKQLEKYEEQIKKQGDQLRLLETQKTSNEKLIDNLREEINILKGERDTWMNKYSDFMKQNNKKDQEESYEVVMMRSQKDELQLKYAQLNDQFNEQSQFLQEQKQWTEHWKNKAVQLETKIQEQQKNDNSKNSQKIEELETRIQRLQLENQHIKSSQILENQIQESERYAKINAEKQELSNQYKIVTNKLDLLVMEENYIKTSNIQFKNEREEKNQIANQLEQAKNDFTEMRINYEKKMSDLESTIKEKLSIIEQMKKAEKEEQIKEINSRQQQEIETLKIRNKIVQLETESGNAKIELEKSQSKLKDYQRELDTWSKKCEALERQHKQSIEELNQHHNQLKQSNIDREVKASKLETEGKIFYLDNQVKILQKEVNVWKEKCQSLELEYEETIKLKNAELNESQNKLQISSQKNLATINEMNDKFDKEQKLQLEKLAEQKHQIKLLQQQIEQIQQENQSLQENSVKRIKELQDIAQKAQQDIKINSYTQLETKIKQLQRQLLQLEIEKNQEIDEKQQQINQLEGEKNQLKEKVQLYSQEIKNLVSYLEKEKQQVEELQKQNSQFQKERDDLDNQINEMKDQLEHKSTNCDFLLQENEQLQSFIFILCFNIFFYQQKVIKRSQT